MACKLAGKMPVLFTTLSSNTERLIQRIIANFCNIPLHHIYTGMLSAEDWSKLDKELAYMPQNLILHNSPIFGYTTLEQGIRASAETHGVKIVFIDGIHLIDMGGISNKSLEEDMMVLLRNLKRLAIELKIPIVTTIPMRKIAVTEWSKLPASCTEGIVCHDAICSVSDVVMVVQRSELFHIYTDEYGNDLRGVAKIHFVKNNLGGHSEITMQFVGDFAKMKSMDAMPHNGFDFSKIQQEHNPFQL